MSPLLAGDACIGIFVDGDGEDERDGVCEDTQSDSSSSTSISASSSTLEIPSPTYTYGSSCADPMSAQQRLDIILHRSIAEKKGSLQNLRRLPRMRRARHLAAADIPAVVDASSDEGIRKVFSSARTISGGDDGKALLLARETVLVAVICRGVRVRRRRGGGGEGRWPEQLGTRTISSVSKVSASTTWRRDVC